MSLDDFFTVTDNSSKFQSSDIVSICKRKNNSKRDFLFVNSLQGKHIHVSPIKIFSFYDELVGEIKKSVKANESIVVIGFAETATAIGHYIAETLPNCIYYMQTTRENVPNAKSLLEFSEEHSHATEQTLYGDIKQLTQCDRVIFVDDEITTGNTILNFIIEIEKLNLHLKYGVASLLNWQDEKWSRMFAMRDIETYCVLRGKIQSLSKKVTVEISDESFDYTLHDINLCKSVKILEVKNEISDYFKERTGFKPYGINDLYKIMSCTIIPKLEGLLPAKNNNVLVLGTEEFMFTPMIIANILMNSSQCDVQFQATTRSPIETSNSKEYVIKHRYPIRSCYDSNRKTYIYNLERYDKVYIITDVIPTDAFIKDISVVLTYSGCNINDIVIIIMKG